VNRRDLFTRPCARAEPLWVDYRLSPPCRVNTGMRLQKITFGEMSEMA